MGANASSPPDEAQRQVHDERFGGAVGLLECRGRVYVIKDVQVDSS